MTCWVTLFAGPFDGRVHEVEMECTKRESIGGQVWSEDYEWPKALWVVGERYDLRLLPNGTQGYKWRQ